MLAMRVLTNAVAANSGCLTAAQHSRVCGSLLDVNMAALKDSQLLAVASYLLKCGGVSVGESGGGASVCVFVCA